MLYVVPHLPFWSNGVNSRWMGYLYPAFLPSNIVQFKYLLEGMSFTLYLDDKADWNSSRSSVDVYDN